MASCAAIPTAAVPKNRRRSTPFLSAMYRAVLAKRPRLPIGDRHGELEGGAVGRTRTGPESPSVSLDDGTADRESHTHAGWLGGEEAFEKAVCRHGVETHAGVRNHHEGFTRVGDPPADLERL